MTIKGLWDYINKYQKRCCVTVPIESFKGLRIAIDVMGVFFRLRMRVRGQLARKSDVVTGPLSEETIDLMWYKEITRFISELLAYGITPLLIFEHGTPRLKIGKRKEREEERVETQRKIDVLRKNLQLTPYNITQLNSIRSLESSLKYVGGESRSKLYDYIRDIGIPCVEGHEGVEAERLASVFVRYGVAAAVYSPDGDCLAHGAPFVIRERGESVYSDGRENATFSMVILDRLLRDMRLSLDTFREICIMSGCDYNKNIPHIGFANSYDLLSTYLRIDKIPESILQKKSGKDYKGRECLIYEDCREEFGDAHPFELMKAEGNLEDMIDSGRFNAIPTDIQVVMSIYGTERYAKDIMFGVSRLPKPRVFEHGTERVVEIAGGEMTIVTGSQLKGMITSS